MDEAKIQELRTIHRDLAEVIGKQEEFILTVTPIIAAIRQTVETEPLLKGKYANHLSSLKKRRTY